MKSTLQWVAGFALLLSLTLSAYALYKVNKLENAMKPEGHSIETANR
jgi:hypothetical protein